MVTEVAMTVKKKKKKKKVVTYRPTECNFYKAPN